MEFTRRSLIKTSLAFALHAALPGIAEASRLATARQLLFYNTHTGESLKSVYWENGTYMPEALKDINYILRDHRTGDSIAMDLRLLDTLYVIHQRMESSRPFEVISGYRTPRSNQMLHEHSSGVAVNSMHLYGKAIDIRLSDRSLHSLRDTAWNLQQGGVGYYPHSDFVHVDTGNVRKW